MHHQYDKSSKWLIQHYGNSILRLAGVRDFVAWRPLAAEMVQSRGLPDGLIEVRRQGQSEQELYISKVNALPHVLIQSQRIVARRAKTNRGSQAASEGASTAFEPRYVQSITPP